LARTYRAVVSRVAEEFVRFVAPAQVLGDRRGRHGVPYVIKSDATASSVASWHAASGMRTKVDAGLAGSFMFTVTEAADRRG
jgi:hypothetical protein